MRREEETILQRDGQSMKRADDLFVFVLVVVEELGATQSIVKEDLSQAVGLQTLVINQMCSIHRMESNTDQLLRYSG